MFYDPLASNDQDVFLFFYSLAHIDIMSKEEKLLGRQKLPLNFFRRILFNIHKYIQVFVVHQIKIDKKGMAQLLVKIIIFTHIKTY